MAKPRLALGQMRMGADPDANLQHAMEAGSRLGG